MSFGRSFLCRVTGCWLLCGSFLGACHLPVDGNLSPCGVGEPAQTAGKTVPPGSPGSGGPLNPHRPSQSSELPPLVVSALIGVRGACPTPGLSVRRATPEWSGDCRLAVRLMGKQKWLRTAAATLSERCIEVDGMAEQYCVLNQRALKIGCPF